jgi:putative transposase
VAQCWDTAPAEGFFASPKRELAHGERDTARDEPRASILGYVGVFDTRVRRHSSLGYVSPAGFERAHNPKHP